MKKSKTKKLLASLMAASAMCLTAVPFTAFADEAVNYEDMLTLAENLDNSNVTERVFDEEATKAKLELMKKGEYPIDFNGDGKVDFYDAETIIQFYTEISTGAIDMSGNELNGHTSSLDAETRQRVHEYGDIAVQIDHEKYVDALDASTLLIFLKENGYFNGDVNHDGAIDALDASLVLECYSLYQVKDDSRMDVEWRNVYYTGDINEDNSTDALDASEILMQYSEAQTNK